MAIKKATIDSNPINSPFRYPLKVPMANNTRIMMSTVLNYIYASNAFTFWEINFPSALPASCLVATPITLPMSLGPSAPT